ncbi:MAG: hypothetical protein COA78_13840 [Blastopirellula sp.]|nr:MAG: hypothetical protein COA78_13840 [Blastopirellula sp.]
MGIDWHPNGQQLAWGSVSGDCSLRIWDATTNKIVELKGSSGSHRSIRWNHDGSHILATGIQASRPLPWQDGTNFVIWKRVGNDWKVHVTGKKNQGYEEAEWNYDGTLIALNLLGKPGIVDSETLHQKFVFPIPGLNAIGWHQTKNLLAVGTNAGKIVILDVDQKTEIMRFDAHFGAVNDVRWSPNGKNIASCSNDGLVKLWKTDDWSMINSYSGHKGIVNSLSWHPDSDRVASSGYDGLVNIWPIKADQPKYGFTIGGNASKNLFAWTSDNLIRTSFDGQIIDINPRTGETQRTIQMPSDNAWYLRANNFALSYPAPKTKNTFDVALSNESGSFVKKTVEAEKQISYLQAWSNPNTSEFIYRLDNHYSNLVLCSIKDGTKKILGDDELVLINHVAWSPDNTMIAATGASTWSDDNEYLQYAGWLHLFNASTGEKLTALQVGKNRVRASSIAWSPDSSRIVAGTVDGLCEIFDTQTHRKLSHQSIHRIDVTSLSWHPDNSRIASGSKDRTVAVWDIESGEVLLRFKVDAAVEHVEWSPDGQILGAKDATGKFHVWDATNGHALAKSSSFQEQLHSRLVDQWNTLLSSGDFLKASEIAIRLMEQGRDWDRKVYYHAGLLHAARDTKRYQQTCQKMLTTFADSDEPLAIHSTVWTCGLAPNAIEDYAPAIRLARHIVAKEPNNKQYLNDLGTILMRAGQYGAAKVELEKALAAGESVMISSNYIRYFLAMTEHHLGHKQAAQDQLQTANDAATKELEDSPVWNRKLTLELLRKEAEALINQAKDSKEPTPPEN